MLCKMMQRFGQEILIVTDERNLSYFHFFVCKSMGCSSADCSSASSTLTYPDILQHNFTILHSNEVGFLDLKENKITYKMIPNLLSYVLYFLKYFTSNRKLTR